MTAHTDSCRRHADLERQFESLDQKEHEIHQSQLRLFREQMAAFVRDLQLVRQDLSALEAENATLLEALQGAREWQSLQERTHLLTEERVALLERGTGALGEHCQRQDRQMEGLHDRCRLVASRMDVLEKLQGESGDRQAQEWVNFRASLDQYTMSLESLQASQEKQAASLQSLRAERGKLHEHLGSARAAHRQLEQEHLAAVDRIAQVEKGLHDTCSSTMGRVDALEELLHHADRRHSEEMSQLRATQSEHAAKVQRVEASLAEHASFSGRLATIDSRLNLADGATVELKALSTAQALQEAAQRKCADDLGTLRTAMERHNSLEDRVRAVESLLGESVGDHARRLQAGE